MISASKEFKKKLKEGANVVNYADFTLSDGTVLHLEPKDFMIGGCQIEDKTTDGKFGVGFCIGKTLTLRIANHDEQFSQYDFYQSIINLYMALILDDGSIEKIRKGVYYTTVPQTPGDIIEISAVDGMYKLDKDYSNSTTIYPATLQKIITDVCLDCGIPIGFRQFDNMNFTVQGKPEKATYRQVMSWACQIAGYNARIDNGGYMQLIWYNTKLLDMYNYHGGDFKTYPHNTVIYGGNFTDYSTDTIISSGSFTDEMPEHIFRLKSLDVHTDDVQITGVKVIGEEERMALFGEEGYLVEVSGNPFANNVESTVASYLGSRIVGLTFRPFSAEILNNPLYEPFDIVRISDIKENVYVSLLNSISYKVGGFTQISCEAEDPLRSGSSYYSQAAAAVVEARRNTEKQLTTYDKAVQQMNQLAANAMGLYFEKEVLQDGSSISYESTKPITVDENGKCHFEQNSTVYKKTGDGFFVSTDGGKSYTTGFDKDGNAVVNVLYAIGIVADWIRSGRFEVRKGNTLTFLADVDTGEVRINADSVSISGTSVADIAQEKVDAQTQQSIFNKLTNNGQAQGLYLQNGQLYMNASYINAGFISANLIKGGTLVLGGTNNEFGQFILLNSYGQEVITNDQNGLHVKNGHIEFGEDYGLRASIAHSYIVIENVEGTQGSGVEISNSGRIELWNATESATINTLGATWFDSRSSIDLYGGKINLYDGGDMYVDDKLKVGGDFTVVGKKSRAVETQNYQKRLQYCYEMPSPMFGDTGNGKTDENGDCYIFIDDMFWETIDTNCQYQVFLQKYGQGDIWVEECKPNYFLIKGTPNLKFAWEIKAKQLGYEIERLELFEDNNGEPLIDYEIEFDNYVKTFYEEVLNYDSNN